MSLLKWRFFLSPSFLTLLLLILIFQCGAQVRQNNNINGVEQYDQFPQYKYIYHPTDNDMTMRIGGPHPTTANVPADDRTFISDIIGFSAFKLMFLLAIPMLLSVFLGAMLVLLFPFPLLTSTTGLAGAAAVGRRQGRVSEADETHEILQLLGLETPNAGYYPMSDNNMNMNNIGIGIGGDEENNHKVYRRVKKQFKTLPKMKRLKILASSSTLQEKEVRKENESCIKRIACEIGKENKDPDTRELVGKIINNLPLKSQQKWKYAIQAYMDGIQSQQHGVMISSSALTSTLSDNVNPVPNSNPLPPSPVYRHNFCPKYKCSL